MRIAGNVFDHHDGMVLELGGGRHNEFVPALSRHKCLPAIDCLLTSVDPLADDTWVRLIISSMALARCTLTIVVEEGVAVASPV